MLSRVVKAVFASEGGVEDASRAHPRRLRSRSAAVRRCACHFCVVRSLLQSSLPPPRRTAMDDDLPSLEAEPLLFTLTHTAAAAATADDDDDADGGGGGRGKRGGRGGRAGRGGRGGAAARGGKANGKGRKRSRDDDDESEEDSGDSDSDESDFSHSSDDEDGASEAEEEEDEADAAIAAAASADVGFGSVAASSSYAAPAPRPRRARKTSTKEVDINGVARPAFPAVQSVHSRSAHEPCLPRQRPPQPRPHVDSVACVCRLVQASAFLGREVNVLMIAKLANNAVFMPVRSTSNARANFCRSPFLLSDLLLVLSCLSQPGGVRFSLRRPSGYAKVNTSGKFVLMGGKSTMDMVTIARKIARKVQKIPEHGVRTHAHTRQSGL